MSKCRLTVGFLIICSIITMTLAQDKNEQIVWTRDADIPLPRGGYFAEWHNGGLWLAGGSYWKDGKKLWTNETSFYNPKTQTWSTLKPIPKAVGYGATAKIGKDLFLFGGADANGNLNTNVFRLRDEEWSKIGESPIGFVYPAYAKVGSKVYIFGGSTSASDVTKATNNVLVYDAKANKWGKLNAIPGEPRQIFSAAAIGENIYIFGGVTQKPGGKIYNLDNAFRLNTKTGIWNKVKKMSIAMRAFWASSDGKSIYLIGGYADAGLDSIYRYSPETDSYELVSKLPQPLMDTKFIYNKGTFYGASGEDKLMSRFSGLVIGKIK